MHIMQLYEQVQCEHMYRILLQVVCHCPPLGTSMSSVKQLSSWHSPDNEEQVQPL